MVLVYVASKYSPPKVNIPINQPLPPFHSTKEAKRGFLEKLTTYKKSPVQTYMLAISGQTDRGLAPYLRLYNVHNLVILRELQLHHLL